MNTLMRAAAAVAGCILAAAVAPVHADAFPSKPVRVIVPASPGGGLDIMGRMLGQDLYGAWHEPVVVENRPGAGVMVGTDAATRATADGYTVLIVNTNIASNAILQHKLALLKELSGVSLVATLPNALSVTPAMPVHSMKEFIAYAKSHRVTFGSAGIGVLGHVCGEMLKLATHTDLVHVPYKGGGPVMAALTGGEVNAGIVSLASTVPHMKAGRVRILGVTSPKRSPLAPDIPAIAETVPGFEFDGWIGLLVPAGTPAPVIRTINAAVAKSIGKPEMRTRMAAQGYDAQASTPQAFDALVKGDVAKFSKVIAEAGIKGN
jgi:tripartite-type tricarboxylate transporter receptor subunit TctC